MKTLMKAARDMRYGTRRLKAGDYFEASGQHARVLSALKRAAMVPGNRMPATIPPIPEKLKAKAPKPATAPVDPDGNAPSSEAPADPLDHDGDGKKGGAPKPEQTGDLSELRAEYERVIGRRPFMGWGAEVLRKKIAEASDGE
jgi:hypothetical protein